MTQEDKWYKNRILWKAKKNYLFDYNGINFDDLDKEFQDCFSLFLVVGMWLEIVA